MEGWKIGRLEDWRHGGMGTATTKANGWIATAVVPPRNDKKKTCVKNTSLFQMVAGAGFEPTTFRL